MTSLTATEILTRLGWTQLNLPNSVIKEFTAPRDEYPHPWRNHRVNRYLFTLCNITALGSSQYRVMLCMRDEEVIQRLW